MADETYAAAELATELRTEPGKHVAKWAGLVDDRDDLKTLIRLDKSLDVPVETTTVGRSILDRAATETVDEAVRGGNVSQMKAATGMNRNNSDEGTFFWEIGRRLMQEGTIGLVFGSPGSGKTAKMLDAGMTWKGRTNGRIFGNLESDILDGEFRSDREMFEQMASFQGKSLALIDEVASSLDGMNTRSKQATEFVNRLRMIRKLDKDHGPYAKRGSALLVAHTRNGTAKDIRRMASFGIEVPNKRNRDKAVLLESKDGSDEWDKKESYSGISDTSANYEEHEASSFEVTDPDTKTETEEYPDRPDNWNEIQLALNRYVNEDMTRAEALDHSKIGPNDATTVSKWKQKYAHESWTAEIE